jgi:hypothetical protein
MKPNAAKRSDRAKRDDGDYEIGHLILTNRRTFLLDNLTAPVRSSIRHWMMLTTRIYSSFAAHLGVSPH